MHTKEEMDRRWAAGVPLGQIMVTDLAALRTLYELGLEVHAADEAAAREYHMMYNINVGTEWSTRKRAGDL